MFGLIGVFGKQKKKKKTKICVYLDGTSAGRRVGWEITVFTIVKFISTFYINFLYHITIYYISHVYL